MLMVPQGSQFENPEPGSYLARCYGFIDLGTQLHKATHASKQDWLQRDVRFLFEMPLYKMEGIYKPEAKGKPFVTSTTLRFSLDPKANMRKMIKGWRGKDLTPDEAKAFVVKKMVGAPVRVSLVEKGEYTNIDSFSRVSPEEAKSMPAMVNPAIYFALDPEEFDRKVFDSLSDKTKDKIFMSPEYKALIGEKSQSAGEPEESPFLPEETVVPVATRSSGGTPRTEAESANLVSRGAQEDDENQPPF